MTGTPATSVVDRRVTPSTVTSTLVLGRVGDHDHACGRYPETDVDRVTVDRLALTIEADVNRTRWGLPAAVALTATVSFPTVTNDTEAEPPEAGGSAVNANACWKA